MYYSLNRLTTALSHSLPSKDLAVYGGCRVFIRSNLFRAMEQYSKDLTEAISRSPEDQIRDLVSTALGTVNTLLQSLRSYSGVGNTRIDDMFALAFIICGKTCLEIERKSPDKVCVVPEGLTADNLRIILKAVPEKFLPWTDESISVTAICVSNVLGEASPF